MSLTINEKILCPCGMSFAADIVSSINAQQDPQLKDMLLAGELNIVKCPFCGEVFYVEHFLLYIDPPNEIIAFIYPYNFFSEKETWRLKMLSDFKNAQDALLPEEKIKYEPMLFFGLDAFLEFLHREEELQDEIEIVKYLSEKFSIPTIKLRPSKARERNIPNIFPAIKVTPSDTQKQQIINGLKKIFEFCYELQTYKNVLKLLEEDSEFNIEIE